MPNEDTKFKYQVSYYNNNMVSFCPASALHDFAVNFNVFMPKSITKSNRDQAILDALSDLDPGILKEEREKLLSCRAETNSASSSSQVSRS